MTISSIIIGAIREKQRLENDGYGLIYNYENLDRKLALHKEHGIVRPLQLGPSTGRTKQPAKSFNPVPACPRAYWLALLQPQVSADDIIGFNDVQHR